MNYKSNVWKVWWFYRIVFVLMLGISIWYNVQQHSAFEDIHGFSIDLLERNKELVKYEHGWDTLTEALGIPDDQAEQLLENINQGR